MLLVKRIDNCILTFNMGNGLSAQKATGYIVQVRNIGVYAGQLSVVVREVDRNIEHALISSQPGQRSNMRRQIRYRKRQAKTCYHNIVKFSTRYVGYGI